MPKKNYGMMKSIPKSHKKIMGGNTKQMLNMMKTSSPKKARRTKRKK